MRAGAIGATTIHAAAKVNLTLEVLARRDDGYHALRSVMLPIALADELTVTPADRFVFRCFPDELRENNLVVRALERIGLAGAPLELTLTKRIPAGAGLGGGSSDAAAVLRAAMSGALGPVPARDWLADARALGSDVPFFLAEGPALVEGTGERVTALGPAPPWWVVLVAPNVHVASGPAYAALDAARAEDAPPARPRNASASLALGEALQRADFGRTVALLRNDFQEAIVRLHPEVCAALRALRDAGAAHALLSGSGGACFALCEHEAPAHALAARLRPPAGAQVHAVPVAASSAWRQAPPR